MSIEAEQSLLNAAHSDSASTFRHWIKPSEWRTGWSLRDRVKSSECPGMRKHQVMRQEALTNQHKSVTYCYNVERLLLFRATLGSILR